MQSSYSLEFNVSGIKVRYKPGRLFEGDVSTVFALHPEAIMHGHASACIIRPTRPL